ncbi:hypothetical protein OSB04_un000451 [Centaurea solstitialis]|uniref:Jacalin-type lectin domain-containing protein n=1 Tax=Centaurea solstitialis TaxID=347529 RepID=A0AA38W3L9_9ASTR|nr:hypothetical protein OSB04_un000451 [Centaurea solstitialis]
MESESISKGCIPLGPWGGSEGRAWIWMPKGNIKKITIVHQDIINCIKFESEDSTGETESPLFGLPCIPSSTDTISIDYPNEYFVSISGTYDLHRSFEMVIKSLCFVTNKKRYGPYGLEAGTRFSYDAKGCVIVGFHGRAAVCFNAIGIYLMPESLAFGRNSTQDVKSTHEMCSSCKSKLVMPKEIGPFGAFAGKYWDDGVFSIVKQIHVFMDESLKVLRAIQFVYVKRDSKLFLSSMHGGTSKDKLELAALVNLDGTDEYLTRISGFYGPVGGFNGVEAITSITFHTNKMTYGPFGEESGDGFTSTESPGKVVGFHGRECNGLLSSSSSSTAFSAFVFFPFLQLRKGTKISHEGCISHGPWGGLEGKAWIWMPKGNIIKITIMHKEVIDAIKFQGDDCTAETESPFYGPPFSDSRTDTICIDYPNEYLVSISGTYSKCYSSLRVKSLCFVTNKKRYGPYGSDSGTRFSYDGNGGVIVGFHGRAGAYLDAIGIYVMPGSLAFCRNSTSKNNSIHESCCRCMSRVVTRKEAGPWGASAGKLWDDGVFSTVKHVNVFMEESLKRLRAIQFVYVKRDGKFFLSPMHGETCKDKLELASMVNLDGTHEYISRISGFYGPVEGFNGFEAITSITFHTNKTVYGPYGEEQGDGYAYFTSTLSPGKVVGFHGRKCDGLLTAIGVHMEYM